MKIIFCLVTVVVGSATLVVTDDQIVQWLGEQQSDSTTPCPIQWLHQWGVDHSTLIELGSYVQGLVPPTGGIKKSTMALFLFFLDPVISLEKFQGQLETLYGPNHATHTEVVNLYTQIQSFKSIPDWLYQFVFDRDASRNSIHSGVVDLVTEMQDLGQIDARDIRFNRGPEAIRALTAIWMWVAEDQESTARFNQITSEWVLSLKTQRNLFRHLTLVNQK